MSMSITAARRRPTVIHVKNGVPINKKQAELAKKSDYTGKMSKAIFSVNVRPPETAVLGVPGTLNRSLNREEKDYIRKNFNLEHLTQKEGDKLTDYLEERGILSPREYIPPEQTTVEYNMKLYGKDYMCVMYGYDQGVDPIFFSPEPGDDFLTALALQVELNHLNEKGIAQDKQIIPPQKKEHAYQEELLKSMSTIYKDMGAGSCVDNVKAIIKDCYAQSRENYISSINETSKLTGQSFSSLAGEIPSLNELLAESLKMFSSQLEDSKSMTMNEWMNIFDQQEERKN